MYTYNINTEPDKIFAYQWLVRAGHPEDGSITVPTVRRDEFGQLDSIQGAYEIATYASLKADSVACRDKAKEDWDGKDVAELHEDYRKCIGEHMNSQFGRSLELVFGVKASPGFICGVKDAVIGKGKTLPGYCCLDAPYQLDGSAWGHEVGFSTNDFPSLEDLLTNSNVP